MDRRSLAEVEYRAMVVATSELKRMKALLVDLAAPQNGMMKLFCEPN